MGKRRLKPQRGGPPPTSVAAGTGRGAQQGCRERWGDGDGKRWVQPTRKQFGDASECETQRGKGALPGDPAFPPLGVSPRKHPRSQERHSQGQGRRVNRPENRAGVETSVQSESHPDHYLPPGMQSPGNGRLTDPTVHTPQREGLAAPLQEVLCDLRQVTAPL